MGLVDRDIIRRYRKWLIDYFRNEFSFESNMFLTLGKVRDFVSGALASG